MTKEQKMMAWHYAKIRSEAVDVLAEILDEKVEDTKSGVCNALALVLHCKGAKDRSCAMLAASSWIWGFYEAEALGAEAAGSDEEPAASDKTKTAAVVR